MAPNADPWRTLGLSPGATQDEIRRAYRRLAKINHPDAAGDASLPRFLAIQAAYEQLAGPGRVRRIGARPPSRGEGAGPAGDAREPWRADPSRARASGRADGRRTPGARPTGPGARAKPTGEPPTGGGSSGARPGAGPSPGTSPPRGSGPETGGPTAAGGRTRRSTKSRRPSTTASPGSTSYEGADKEPFEPGWSGATWYGASSGTYWTINPKEYADPRKHGPEYQARARRARAGDTIDDPAEALDASEPSTAADADVRPDSAEPFSGGAAADASAPDGPDRNPARPASRPASADPPGGRRPSGRPSGRRGGTAATGSRRTADAGAGRPGAAAAAGLDGAPWTGSRFARPARSPGGDAGHGAPPINGLRVWIEQPADDRGFRGPLLRRPTTPAGRFAMALLGWPPLGAFAAATIDQSTGCGRYAASCPEISAPGTWILEVAIVFLLLALPSLAAWSAHGTIATLVVGVPSAIILSAAGGTNVREASAPILLGVLAVAYLAGVAYAVIVGRRPARV